MKKTNILIALIALWVCVFSYGTAKADYTYAVLNPSDGMLTIKYNKSENKVLQEDASVVSDYIFHIGYSGDGSLYLKKNASAIKIIKIDGTVSYKTNWTSVKELFHDLPNLTEIIWIYNLKLGSNSNVTMLTNGVKNCSKLTSIDGFNNLITKNIQNMEGMFDGCSKLSSINTSGLNTSSVTTMKRMFAGCTNLRILDLTNFSTQNVSNMTEMFYSCQDLEAIFVGSYWNTDKVSNSNSQDMFLFCSRLQNYNGNNSNDKNFANTSSSGYLSKPSAEKQGYAYVHGGTLHFCYDTYKTWQSYNVENTGNTYPGWTSSSGNAYIKKVVVETGFSNVKPKSTMFWFFGLSNLAETKNLNSLNLMDATTTWAMFSGCSSLKEVNLYNNSYPIKHASEMSYMFSGCTSLESVTLPQRQNVQSCNMEYMFYNCKMLKKIPDQLNVQMVGKMNYMFAGCESLSGEINLALNTNFITNYCTDFSHMFDGCTNITVLRFNGSFGKATTTEAMFANCTALTKVYFTSEDKSSALTNTKEMFSGDEQLTKIFFLDQNHCLDVSNVTESSDMFAGCKNLRGGKGSSYTVSERNRETGRGRIVTHTDKTYARIDKGRTEPGLFSPYISSISYILDGGYENNGNFPEKYNVDNEASVSAPSKSGYIFTGWTISGGLSVTEPVDKDPYVIPAGTMYNLTFTANWIRNIANSDIKISLASDSYTGNDIKVIVKDGVKTLVENTDYTINKSSVRIPGQHYIEVTGMGSYGGKTSKTLQLKKAYINVYIDDKEKVYGDDDPEFTYQATGLKGDDKITKMSLIRTDGEKLGNYKIYVGSWDVDNGKCYDINPAEGYLTITAKPITVTPDALSKTYGEDDPEEFTYTVEGLKEGDKLTGSLSRVEGENVGEYLISGSLTNSNYEVSVADVKFVINKKDITVTPSVLSKVYDDPDPEFTYSVEGLVEGDNLTGNLSRESGEDVGEYSFVNSLTNDNYNIQLAAKKFEITRKKVTPTLIFETDVMMHTGSALEPKVSVLDNGKPIPETEYAISYSNNVEISDEAKVIVSNVAGGNYEINTTEAYFSIVDESNAIAITYKTDGDDIIVYTVTNQALPRPVKEGYTAHAYKDAAKTTEWNYETDKVDGTITTLYLNWMANSHTITYTIDGTPEKVTLFFGDPIPEKSGPAKTGYSFAWDTELPATMPDRDLTANGVYTKNSYYVIYTIDGEEYHREKTEYEDAITPIAAPVAKTGYSFSGWSAAPATMPDKDVNVTGTYIANKHKLVFNDNGTAVKTIDEFTFGADITTELPTKEYHKYTYALPSTGKLMPDADVTVEGVFEPNRHNIIYAIDGEQYKVVEAGYGETITPIAAPEEIEGFTFSGWSKMPATMPDEDVNVTGSYTANKHDLVITIDGETLPAVEVSYDTKIENLIPKKIGYKFVASTEYPSTMPDANLTIEGVFEQIPFYLYYYVDNDLYLTEELFYGDEIIPAENPEPTGRTFNGWSGIPSTMPAENVYIYGYSELNFYTLTYKIDGEVVSTSTKVYGASINEPQIKDKEGHTFSGWDSNPSVMPDHNLVISGSYIKNKYTITYKVDGEIIQTDEVEFEAAITAAPAPEKEGFTFNGWKLNYTTMPSYDIIVEGTFTENAPTPVAETADGQNSAKVWAYNRTIFIEAQPDSQYKIIDLSGRTITTSTIVSSHEEIQIDKTGIYLVIVNNKTYKTMVR